MMMALDISGNHVMCLDLQKNNVYDLHGKALFGNNVGIEVCYNYIHPDDCEGFRTFIERLANGTDKEADCRYRWNYNYTGKGEPDWHDLHNVAIAEYEDGKPVNIISTITDETEPKRKEREIEQLSDRYTWEPGFFTKNIFGPNSGPWPASSAESVFWEYSSD